MAVVSLTLYLPGNFVLLVLVPPKYDLKESCIKHWFRKGRHTGSQLRIWANNRIRCQEGAGGVGVRGGWWGGKE